MPLARRQRLRERNLVPELSAGLVPLAPRQRSPVLRMQLRVPVTSLLSLYFRLFAFPRSRLSCDNPIAVHLDGNLLGCLAAQVMLLICGWQGSATWQQSPRIPTLHTLLPHETNSITNREAGDLV